MPRKFCVILSELRHARGLSQREAAEALRGTRVYVDRANALQLPEGEHFICDLIGLRAVTTAGEEIGVLKDVYTGPANDVYIVKGEKDYMIPAVSEFLEDVNVDEGYIRVRLIEGMAVE